jgi:hypothetical protein
MITTTQIQSHQTTFEIPKASHHFAKIDTHDALLNLFYLE